MSAAVAALQERNVKHSSELLDYEPDIYDYEFDNPYAPTWDPEPGIVSDAGNDLSDPLRFISLREVHRCNVDLPPCVQNIRIFFVKS